MKKKYTILLIAILLFSGMMAQETQKNFINYQGVARNGAGQLMANENMTVGIALKMGGATGAATYAENHSITTDANGVFSLRIGSGDSVSGDYDTIPWGSGAAFITVLVNGAEIGTTEMMAVPFALSSGDGTQQADEVPYDNSVSGLTATNAQQAIDELVGSGSVDADADPTNELQDISLSGTDLSISEGSTLDLSAIVPPGGGTDDQNAAEVPFDNSVSGLAATDAQAAIDELATSGVVDTDDQDLSLSGTTLQITDGTSVDLSPIIPPGGTDDQNAAEVPFDNTASGLAATDAQAAIDELATSGVVDTDDQDLSLSGTTLQITDGAGVDLSPIIPAGGTDDQNAAEVPFDNTASGLIATDTQAAIDELATSGVVDTDDQDLSLSGTTLQITDGAGVDLSPIIPEGGTDDQNAAEVPFDNTASGLVATHAQAAIDELATASVTSPWTQSGNNIYRNLGRVGIGTNTPAARLAIVGSTEELLNIRSTLGSGDGWIRFNNNTGQVGYLGMHNGTRNVEFGTTSSNTTGKLHLTTEARPRLTVAENGNVGIGTTNPESKLHVFGSARVSGNLFVHTNTGSFQMGNPNNGDRWVFDTSNNDWGLNILSRTTSGSVVSQVTRFGMEHTGEFKIGGIAENEAWLHVRKNSTPAKPQLKLEEVGNDYARLELTNTTSNSFWHVAGLARNNAANSRLNFYFRNANGGGADRMTVTGDGNVGINGDPQARLHIYQRGREIGYGLRFSDGTPSLDWDILHAGGLLFIYGGVVKGGINPSSGAYIQSSDRRLKTNIVDMEPVLKLVNQLRPAMFRYKSDNSNKNTLGLIAQEVQPLFPELVSSSGEDGMLALDYSAFSVVAIKAIQEQTEKIADLEERLKRLEARLNER